MPRVWLRYAVTHRNYCGVGFKLYHFYQYTGWITKALRVDTLITRCQFVLRSRYKCYSHDFESYGVMQWNIPNF